MSNGKHKTQNFSNLFAMMIGIGIGILILNYTMAQSRNHTGGESVEWETYQIWTITTVEIREEWTWSTESGSQPTVKLIKPSNWTESAWDKWIEKADKRRDKPLLRTWDKKVLVKWFPEDSMATNIATYAYQVSNWDMDFLMTLKAENGWFDMYKQSNVPDKYWANGREDSRWICQLHRRRHKAIVDDPRFFTDYRFQVEKCWEKYSWWTRFYGYDVRLKFKNDFTILD